MLSTVALFTILASLVAASPVQQITQNGQCLQVTGTPAGGSPVTLGDCNSSNAQSAQSTGQQWVITAGNNVGVQLYGTTMCLDAQANPETGRPMVVYPCIANGPQTWYLTGDNRIAITGGTQCLNTDGTTAQTTPCGPGITTQAFDNTLLFDTETATSIVSSQPTGTGGVVVGASSLAASATSGAAAGTSSAAQSASAVASSVEASASSVASAAAMSASSAVSSASGAASGILGSASSGASSALSTASAGASSVASDVTSGAGGAASSVTSGAGGAASSVTSGAGGAASSVTSGAGGAASSVTSGAGGAASSVTSGAGGIASSVTSGAGGIASSITSGVAAATSAVTGAGVINQVSLGKVAVALGGVALGAVMVL